MKILAVCWQMKKKEAAKRGKGQKMRERANYGDMVLSLAISFSLSQERVACFTIKVKQGSSTRCVWSYLPTARYHAKLEQAIEGVPPKRKKHRKSIVGVGVMIYT